MKRTGLQAAWACAILAIGQSNALATDIYSEAEFRNLGLSFVDLTPGDGNAAGISVIQTAGSVATNAYDGVSALSDYKSLQFSDLAPINVNSAQGTAQASVVGSGTVSHLHSSAAVSGYQQDASGYTSVDNRYTITVQPHTSFTISGQLALQVSLSGMPSTAIGHSSGSFSLGDIGSGDISHGGGTFSANLNLGPDGSTPSPYSYDFSYTYTNNSDSIMYAGLQLSTSNLAWNTDPNTPPVPEPETYLMLGTGLLMLRAARRWRKSN